jgi:hypothetical protein
MATRKTTYTPTAGRPKRKRGVTTVKPKGGKSRPYPKKPGGGLTGQAGNAAAAIRKSANKARNK